MMMTASIFPPLSLLSVSHPVKEMDKKQTNKKQNKTKN